MKSLIFVSVFAVAGFVFLSGCTTHLVAENATPEMSASPVRQIANESADESAKHYTEWAAVTKPSDQPTEIFGSYADGCIAGAMPLPLQSPNYIVMRPSRHAYYGDPSMIRYLTLLAESAHGAGLKPLLVGDISHPRGGPVANGHGSHQVGLDADVWLTMAPHALTTEEQETFEAPSYVINRKELKPTWGAPQVKLITLAADNENVNRIFVSPAIKKYFCANFPKASWLYKLRPWWEHEDHVHIRLNCPEGSTTCRHQKPIDPKDDPCGKDYEWWLSPAADKEWVQMGSGTKQWQRPFPKLPAQCENVRKR